MALREGKFHTFLEDTKEIKSISFEDVCWMCGKVGKNTRHHVISKAFKPLRNLIIPLCRACHDLIHGIEHKQTRRNKKRKHHILRLTPHHS